MTWLIVAICLGRLVEVKLHGLTAPQAARAFLQRQSCPLKKPWQWGIAKRCPLPSSTPHSLLLLTRRVNEAVMSGVRRTATLRPLFPFNSTLLSCWQSLFLISFSPVVMSSFIFELSRSRKCFKVIFETSPDILLLNRMTLHSVILARAAEVPVDDVLFRFSVAKSASWWRWRWSLWTSSARGMVVSYCN